MRTAGRQAGDALRLRQPGRPTKLPAGHQAGAPLPKRRPAAGPAPAPEPGPPSPPPVGRLDGRPLSGHHVRRAADAALLFALTALGLPRGLPRPSRFLDVADARLVLRRWLSHGLSPFPQNPRLPKRAVVQLLLALERFLARVECLEMAASVQHVDPIDVVPRDLQFRKIDVVDLARIRGAKTGSCHGRIVSPPPAV